MGTLILAIGMMGLPIGLILAVLALLIVMAGLNVATTNSANLKARPLAYKVMPLKASTAFKRGGHVMSVGGYLLPCDDTALGIYQGRFFDADVTASGSDGGTSGKVTPSTGSERYQEFVAAAADATWIGKLAAFSNDYTIVLNASSSNHVIAGRIISVLSATLVIVDCEDRFGGNPTGQ